jgi:hypothetical protein
MSRNSLHVLEVGAKVLRNLDAQAVRNRAAGEARRAQIRRIMIEHTGPDRLTAKLIRQRLSCDPPISIRAIQDHMKIINAESSVSR